MDFHNQKPTVFRSPDEIVQIWANERGNQILSFTSGDTALK